MNDFRRSILWVIFGFSMVLLWDQWQVHNGHPATFFPAAKEASATKPADAAIGCASSGLQRQCRHPECADNGTCNQCDQLTLGKLDRGDHRCAQTVV
jgi:hypothetical protein